MRLGSLAVTFLVGVALSGCAATSHFNKQVGLSSWGKDNATFVDAKQRSLVSTSRSMWNGYYLEDIRVFCAEPSPDALSALAANLGADLKVDAKASLLLNAAVSESAGSIGIRTAGVQVLRDIMYRDCEAFANGGLTQFGLETLQRRFQSTMVAILAIEQLTGPAKAASLALGGSTSARNGDDVVKLAENIQKAMQAVATDQTAADTAATDLASANAELKTIVDQKAGLQAAYDTAAAVAEASRTEDQKATIKKYTDLDAKVKPAQTKVETKEKSVKDTAAKLALSTDTLKALQQTQQSVLAGGANTSSSASVTQAEIAKALNNDNTKIVADAVTTIVNDTLSLGYGRELCTSLIGAYPSGTVIYRDAQSLPPTKASLQPTGAAVEAPSASLAGAVVETVSVPPEGDTPMTACVKLLSEDALLVQARRKIDESRFTMLQSAMKVASTMAANAKTADEQSKALAEIKDLLRAASTSSEPVQKSTSPPPLLPP